MLRFSVYILTVVDLQAAIANGVPQGYRVALKVVPDTILVGSAIPVTYTLSNGSDQALPFESDNRGSPAGLMVLDSNEKELTPTPHFVGMTPTLFDKRGLLMLEPGQEIRLQYDLAMFYRIDAPGRYTLRIAPDEAYAKASHHAVAPEADVATARFTAADYRVSDFRELAGQYYPPYTGTSVPQFDRSSSVRLSLVETKATPKPLQFLLIDQIVVMGEERIGLPSYSFAVPVGTQVEKAAMDFFGQVWVVVKTGEKMSLLIWRINDLSWSVLVPPTEKRITFQTGQAIMNSPSELLVSAGVEGEEQFTTYSIAPYSFGGTGKADVNIPIP